VSSQSASLLPVGPALGATVVALLIVALTVSALAQLGYTAAIGRAGARAAVQLFAVSFVIAAIVANVLALLAFVVVMFTVAARTAGRRITPGPSWWWAGLPIAAGVLPVLLLLGAVGLLPLEGLTLIPVAGILIGGALTATALAGRRALDETEARWGEIEAALSLGFLDRDARLLVTRDVAAAALVPALDQTRTVGLVTLPGAFVGMLLGGASPGDAAAVQLFVLVALLAVESVAIASTLELVVRRRLRRPSLRDSR